MHVETYLLDRIGDIMPSEGEVRKGTCKALICNGITDGRAVTIGYLRDLQQGHQTSLSPFFLVISSMYPTIM
jgi:hypothetical protein